MATEVDDVSPATRDLRPSGIQRTAPISDQVHDLIVARIREGGYAPGDQLPSETELAAELGVSRGSVRTALAIVESRGHVTRRHGEGTFVTRRAPAAHRGIADSWDFVTLIEAVGLVARIEHDGSIERRATDDEIAVLEMASGDRVVEMVRVFLGDQEPLIHVVEVLPAGLLEPMAEVDGSLHINELLRKYCGQEIAYSEATTAAIAVDEQVGARLGLAVGTPVVRQRDIFYSVDGERPIWLSESQLNTEKVAIKHIRKWHR